MEVSSAARGRNQVIRVAPHHAGEKGITFALCSAPTPLELEVDHCRLERIPERGIDVRAVAPDDRAKTEELLQLVLEATGPVLAHLEKLLADAAPAGASPPTRKVVYGETTRLGERRLAEAGVTFRQIPYDIKAR